MMVVCHSCCCWEVVVACRGLGYLVRNCAIKPRRRDVANLQTQLLIAQKEEARIQLQAKEFDLMAAAGDLDEIEKVNANCILLAKFQQASTSGTQTDTLMSMTQTDQLRLMDDPNITMEEYIRLKEEKAHRSGKVYNWENAMYGKIWYDEDVHDLISVKP
nr:hypothetical protein [Tanacetum cinerariifolium]